MSSKLSYQPLQDNLCFQCFHYYQWIILNPIHWLNKKIKNKEISIEISHQLIPSGYFIGIISSIVRGESLGTIAPPNSLPSWQHRVLWLSLTTRPYQASLLASPRDGIQCLQNWWMKDFAVWPTLACLWVGVHRRTGFIISSPSCSSYLDALCDRR